MRRQARDLQQPDGGRLGIADLERGFVVAHLLASPDHGAQSGRVDEADAFQVDQSCVDTYSSERTSAAQTLRIRDAASFTLTEADETSTFRLCPAGEAPDYLQDLVTPG